MKTVAAADFKAKDVPCIIEAGSYKIEVKKVPDNWYTCYTFAVHGASPEELEELENDFDGSTDDEGDYIQGWFETSAINPLKKLVKKYAGTAFTRCSSCGKAGRK